MSENKVYWQVAKKSDCKELKDGYIAMPVDQPSFTDDPLADLAAVMRHHGIEFCTGGGIIIAKDWLILRNTDKSLITADDIKPEGK